jgi:2-hydroxychromene-2-carboxylate isomerase
VTASESPTAPEPPTAPESPAQPVFYYDLGSPRCYLVAERIMTALPVVPEWEPVLGSQISAAATAPDRAPRPDREAIERRAAELGLQPLRWPPTWPPQAREAMLAATYAKQIGRAVAFSLAAFRQEFAGGRDLGDRDTVLIAGAACEMHPTALLKGIELRSTAEALEAAGRRAIQAGVTSLPAIELDGHVFEGESAPEEAL